MQQVRINRLVFAIGVGLAIFLEALAAPLRGYAAEMLDAERGLNPSGARDAGRDGNEVEALVGKRLAWFVGEEAIYSQVPRSVVFQVLLHRYSPEPVGTSW
jgi:hypothetical protein